MSRLKPIIPIALLTQEKKGSARHQIHGFSRANISTNVKLRIIDFSLSDRLFQ